MGIPQGYTSLHLSGVDETQYMETDNRMVTQTSLLRLLKRGRYMPGMRLQT